MSACLLGQKCKYNGGDNYNEKVIEYVKGHEVIPACPEVEGGLSVPRKPCEIVQGLVMDKDGESKDKEFRCGAELCLQKALEQKVSLAILQSRSPSCGVNQIYDGTFSGKLIKGSGVFSGLLKKNGIKVLDAEDIPSEKSESSFEMRKLAESEIPAAHSLAWKVFCEYESPDYSEEGTESFRKTLYDPAYLSGLVYYGTFEGSKLVALCAIRSEKRHICFMFVDGSYHRRGIGSRLIRHVLNDYKGGSVTLNSSPYGLPFYKAVGFVPTEEEKTVDGIRFTPMKICME